MSRAPGASFAQFFPTAPRAAKDKAKEREKVKIFSQDSPLSRPVADAKAAVLPNVRIDDAAPSRSSEGGIPTADIAAPLLDEGDLLNGVGSASSHSSTVSSVFSSAAQQNHLSASSNQHINTTPMTNVDSSPSHVASPYHSKSATAGSSFTGFPSEKYLPPQNDVPPPQNTAKARRPACLCSRPEQKCKGLRHRLRSSARQEAEWERHEEGETCIQGYWLGTYNT